MHGERTELAGAVEERKVVRMMRTEIKEEEKLWERDGPVVNELTTPLHKGSMSITTSLWATP